MQLSDIVDWFHARLVNDLWITEVFSVVLGVLVFNFIQKRVLHHLVVRLRPSPKTWDDAFVEALQRPLSVFIWIVGIAFAAQIVQARTGAVIFEAVEPIRDIGVITTITWFLIRLIRRVEENIVRKGEEAGEQFDRTTVDVTGKILRMSLIITAVLVTMQTLGYSISGILAFGGVGGIAVGFAARDLLANFFGGLMIYLDRPFAVGEWIRSPDKEIEGTVEEIGWRLTIIRTFDKRPLYVPNSVFTSIAVENPSRMQNRRIYETIGIRYEDVDKMDAIVKDVKSMLMEHPEIDSSKTLIVNFNSFAPSSLDFFIYTFTKTTEWVRFHEIKQDVLLKISDIIASHGAEIAFPTSTVHLEYNGKRSELLPPGR
jgi:MscS family membrane protein